jgi:hypothetical protein
MTPLTRRLFDALRFVTAIVTWPISRLPVRPVHDENRHSLPGDSFMPNPRDQWTHAITVDAQPRDIWPWLVQLGCRRGGWYSYDGLDNGGVPSADRIVSELQPIGVGDLFAWTPTADDGFFVKAIEPERMLVIGGEAGSLYRVSWAFVLEPIDEHHTRVISRCRGELIRPSGRLRLALMHPVHFAMERRQLLNLKTRVEASAKGRSRSMVAA